MLSPGFQLREDQPVRETLFIVGESHDPGVVEQHGALLFGGLGQVHQQPRVVELTVVVHDAAAESFLLQVRNVGEHLFLPEVA